MSNSTNWGSIYCTTWWGDASNVETIAIDSQPFCFIDYVLSLLL